MIQRIQSLYLLLTAIVSSLFLNGGIINFVRPDGHLIIVKIYGVFQSSGEKLTDLLHYTMPFAIISVLVPVIAVVTIFLFKNKKIQRILTSVLITLEILVILASGYFIFNIAHEQSAVLKPGIKMLFPIICLLLTILAYRGIQKDDRLIKSYDRIR